MSKAALGQVQVGTSATTVVTATGNTTIDAAVACNTTGSAVTLDVFLDPDGTGAAAANQIYNSLSIDANASVALANLVNHFMGNGSTIKATGSTTGVTVTVSGRTGV